MVSILTMHLPWSRGNAVDPKNLKALVDDQSAARNFESNYTDANRR